MRYALNASHHQHFEEHGWIAFEDLLNAQEAKALEAGPARDGWRGDEEVRRLACRRAHIEVVSQLVRAHSLRLAFTERFDRLPEESLDERSCVQGLEAGLLLDLVGHGGVVVRPTLPLSEVPAGEYFLVAFARPNALYIKNEHDPYTHLWKDLGMGFGDSLKDTDHPMVLRR